MNKTSSISNLSLRLIGFLFSVLPLSIISGPFLADLSIFLICILIFFQKNFFIKKKYLRNNFFYFFIILNVYFIISSILSNEVLFSLKSSVFFFRFYLFGFAIWYLLDTNKDYLKYFFYILLISFSALLFDGYLQYFTGTNILGFEIHPGPRISSFFGDELILGSYLSRLLPILLGLIMYFFSKKKILLYSLSAFFLIFSDVLVFLSGERTAFFYINFSCILFIILINGYKLFRITTFIISLILISLILSYSPTYKERIIDLTMEQTGINKKYNQNTKNIKIFSAEHQKIYFTGFEIYKKNKLKGSGPNTFRKFCKEYENKDTNKYICSTHPHNTYLQILLETGLIGIFLFSILLLYFVKSIINILKQNYIIKKSTISNLEICVLISICISLFPFAPTGNFFNNLLSIIYFLPSGIFLWVLNKRIASSRF